ncbi:MAG: hypothetical protein J6R18_05295 [Kiritimatiellae bacterium]|nr:hypothetical protein [Kiritimatiellia bacterium]
MIGFFAYMLFVWVELIGFDNSKPDFGVGDYLGRMEKKPDVVSLLLHNDGLFLTHKEGLPSDFRFLPSSCSYRGRPFNPERRRQEWTAFQLKGLISELQRNGVDVFASFFASEQYPVTKDRAEVVAGKLASFLADYGFNGLHGSDGYAPPRYLLPECEGKERVRIARETAAQYADNWRIIVSALKAKNLKCWLNTCWTRDPYEALYRYGVDYRLLAKTGIDGFVVESSAAAQSIEGWNFQESSPIDRSTAMLMRLKACVPEVPFVLLHAINDGTEQWSALRHSPTRTASEIMALGSVFYGNKRALDGVLACLADGIQAQEWTALGKMWNLSFQPAKGPIGMRVVWSDKAFDREFDHCVVSKDASSNTLLCELIRFQASVNAIVSVEDAIADKNIPVLILNPEFFPKEELEGLRNRMAHVVELGRGAKRPFAAEYIPVPEGTPPFPGMPNNDTCYWKRPLPENMPPEIAFKRAAGSIAWKTSPFTPDTPGLRVYGFMLSNGRMAIFGRNEGDTYMNAAIGFPRMDGTISDVLVHSDFPSLPVTTILRGRIAPHDTMFISVKERAITPPGVPVE